MARKGPARRSLAERFWAKVNKNGPVPEHRPDLGPCWLWTGGRNGNDYGRIHKGGPSGPGAMIYAHRVAWEFCIGPIPPGMEPDHLCRNHGCVNPAHLEPVTHRENVLRGTAPSARGARRTHCPQWHAYTRQNTKRSGGKRGCRTCHQAWDRRRYHERKDANR